MNIIVKSTSAFKAIAKTIPELKNKIQSHIDNPASSKGHTHLGNEQKYYENQNPDQMLEY